MSVAERLRQEDVEDGMFKMAKKMIINGESLEKIISYTELSAEEIKQAREEVLR